MTSIPTVGDTVLINSQQLIDWRDNQAIVMAMATTPTFERRIVWVRFPDGTENGFPIDALTVIPTDDFGILTDHHILAGEVCPGDYYNRRRVLDVHSDPQKHTVSFALGYGGVTTFQSPIAYVAKEISVHSEVMVRRDPREFGSHGAVRNLVPETFKEIALIFHHHYHNAASHEEGDAIESIARALAGYFFPGDDTDKARSHFLMYSLNGTAFSNCPDCDVTYGNVHQKGCDVATCTVSGAQELSCSKMHDGSCVRSVWYGRLEGK